MQYSPFWIQRINNMSRRIFLFAFVCLMTTVSTATADDPKDKKPEAALEGAWTLASLEVNVQKVSGENLTNATMTIKGNKYAFKMQDQSEEGTLKVDGGKKPATIDLDILTGEGQGKKQLGIYELEGTTWKLCLTEAGDETRPKEIQAKEGSKQLLFVFKKKP